MSTRRLTYKKVRLQVAGNTRAAQLYIYIYIYIGIQLTRFFEIKIISVSLVYYACYIHINLSLESLYQLKKSHQNPLLNFKDLNMHRDRQREATLFYTM
jgi:hypothetical protein